MSAGPATMPSHGRGRWLEPSIAHLRSAPYSLSRSSSTSFFALTASSSARSFPILCTPTLLECPLTFLHRTSSWRHVASSSLSHRSLFATGSLRWLSQPFFCHCLYQPLLMQLTR